MALFVAGSRTTPIQRLLVKDDGRVAVVGDHFLLRCREMSWRTCPKSCLMAICAPGHGVEVRTKEVYEDPWAQHTSPRGGETVDLANGSTFEP